MSRSNPRTYPLGASFGVMQGRLSPQTDRGYQAFPRENWANEFGLAATLGFEHIEWVLDSYETAENPLIQSTSQVLVQIERSGVSVPSICADFLMDTPLRVGNRPVWELLRLSMSAMARINADVLVIPCVDNSSLLVEQNLHGLKEALPHAIHFAEEYSIKLALETDLAPEPLSELLEQEESSLLTVNYDSGNSASLGYDFTAEMMAYGHRISDFHIKDRTFGGGSVELGTGDVNFGAVLNHVKSPKFQGIVTMQAMRDAEGLGALRLQLGILHEFINADANK